MEIITRKQAKNENLKHYFTGKQCKHGHKSKRFTDSGSCLECRESRSKGYSKKYYDNNKIIIIERVKDYASNNSKKIKLYQKKYKSENSEKLSEYRKEYYKNNRERYKISRIKRFNRIKDDPKYKLSKVLREMVRRSLDERPRNCRTFDLIGYNNLELKKHIEDRFKDGMSWDNYGEWHIDHIISIKKFIDSGETDPKIINALSNLQPLWAVDNIRKGA